MNKRSLSHNYVKNQQVSSWIDDPFQLEPHIFKGLKSMSNQTTLDEFIQELVSNYGQHCSDHYELTLEMVPESDKNHLVLLYIESIDREIEWACYGKDESINSDFLCDMISMLKLDTPESREKFAETTRQNLLCYYNDVLEELLETGCEIYFQNQMNEADYHNDYERGDIIWRKFK